MKIRPSSLARVPIWLRPFFWRQRRKYGAPLDAALMWARSPRLFAGVAMLYGAIDRSSSPIEPALRSLITVRISQINACEFCVDINSATLLKRGVSLEKLDALREWRGSDLFDECDRAVLEYAEAITISGSNVEDRMIEQLRLFFDEDGVVELTALIAFQNLSSKFNNALGIPSQGFCQMPWAGTTT